MAVTSHSQQAAQAKKNKQKTRAKILTSGLEMQARLHEMQFIFDLISPYEHIVNTFYEAQDANNRHGMPI